MNPRIPVLPGLALLIALQAPFALAQGIHQSVGPDGRVTYSDMPSSGSAKAARPPVPKVAEKTSAMMDPELERAVITVLSTEDLVHQTESICLNSQPTSMSKYMAATDGWRKRNSSLATLAHRALDRPVGEATLRAVKDAIKVRNERMLSPVTSASAQARVSWCDRSMNEVTAGKLDVFDKPQLSGPLSRVDAGEAKRAAH